MTDKADKITWATFLMGVGGVIAGAIVAIIGIFLSAHFSRVDAENAVVEELNQSISRIERDSSTIRELLTTKKWNSCMSIDFIMHKFGDAYNEKGFNPGVLIDINLSEMFDVAYRLPASLDFPNDYYDTPQVTVVPWNPDKLQTTAMRMLAEVAKNFAAEYNSAASDFSKDVDTAIALNKNLNNPREKLLGDMDSNVLEDLSIKVRNGLGGTFESCGMNPDMTLFVQSGDTWSKAQPGTKDRGFNCQIAMGINESRPARPCEEVQPDALPSKKPDKLLALLPPAAPPPGK